MSKKRWLVIGITIFFLCILFLAGCKKNEHVPKHTQWMEKWLTNPTCYPPCLEGITPGISTAKEAADKEFLLSDVKRTSSPYYDEKAVVPEYGCQRISFYPGDSDGIVEFTIVDVSCEKDNTTVKEIIRVYGNPDYMYAHMWGDFGCERRYVWANIGMEIVGYKERAFLSLFTPLDPEILVSRIYLFDPKNGPDSTIGTENEYSPFTSIENDPCEN